MKILVYRWRAYNYKDFIHALKEQGHDVYTFSYDIRDFDDDPKFLSLLKDLLDGRDYNFVMSINYFTMLAEGCHRKGIPYVCWNCDSMLISMYNQSVFYPGNFIFTFDCHDVAVFRAMGVKHIYYLPLAADAERMQREIHAGTEEREIAFIGDLYERNQYDAVYPKLPEYLKGYLDASLWAQLQVCGGNLLMEMLTDDIMIMIQDYFRLEKAPESFADLGLIFTATVLGFKAANIERISCLNTLSLYHLVDLFSTSGTQELPRVCHHGRADYWTETPDIFHASKINLNFTIPNIIDGTPLRIMDILASGGFCLTTGREDLLRLFKNGRELVVFEGKEDLLRKVDYYLEHDTERIRIAQAGQEAVMKKHSYKVRLKEMFQVLSSAVIK